MQMNAKLNVSKGESNGEETNKDLRRESLSMRDHVSIMSHLIQLDQQTVTCNSKNWYEG
jgi:hypothetical protein